MAKKATTTTAAAKAPKPPAADQTKPPIQAPAAPPAAPAPPVNPMPPVAPVEPAPPAPPVSPEPIAYEGPVLVVTGPAKGFRRGGFAFGADPVALTPADFGVDADNPVMSSDASDRFLAIIEEPALKALIRMPDGEEQELLPEAIAAIRVRAETLLARHGEGPIGELIEELLDEAAHA